jgi:hypothetical protein
MTPTIQAVGLRKRLDKTTALDGLDREPMSWVAPNTPHVQAARRTWGVPTTPLNSKEADRCDACRSTGATTPAELASGDDQASTSTRPRVRMTARPWSGMRHRR